MPHVDMGCNSSSVPPVEPSRTSSVVKTDPRQPSLNTVKANVLDKKLVEAVIGAKARSMQNPKLKSFNFLMMQFPKLRTGFKKVHELFKQVNTSGDKHMDWETFRSNCAELGLDSESNILVDAFTLADMDSRQKINADELVLIFTIVYLLDHSDDKHVILFPEIKEALEIVEQAFVYFDSSKDGNLERKEVVMAMKSGTRVFGRKQAKSLAGRLFDELDLDGSGNITFKEFLIAIERMALEVEEDSMKEETYFVEEVEEDTATKNEVPITAAPQKIASRRIADAV